MENLQVYIASTLSNAERVSDLRDKLANSGIALTYDWTKHGRISDQALLGKIAERQLRGVIEANCLLVVMPGGSGTFFEFGVAYGLRKPIVVLLDKYTGPPEPNLSLSDVVYCITEEDALRAVQTRHITASHLIDRLLSEEYE